VAELLSLAEAQRAVLAHARPLPAELVPVEEASGRVLAESARARVDLPLFDSSAMDGHAVRAADVPGRLRVVGVVETGRPANRNLSAGEAMAIGTGGAVPGGADAVIPIEYVVVDGNEIEVERALDRGANIRPRGRDVRVGDSLVAAGAVVSAARVGALAAAGVSEVVCGRRPQVAILATGSELRPPGADLAPGQIYEANSLLLASAAGSTGASVTRLAPVADDEAAHREALGRGLLGDVLITSGGVSVGTQDLVRRVEVDLGVQEVFWRVAVKPGKPVSFGVRGGTLAFGLPGNPVSALVGFELFVRPALLALQGASDPLPRFLPGRLGADVRRNAERDELLRARRDVDAGGVALHPVSGQESHMIARAATADALVFVPRGDGVLAAGAPVRYLELS
jgi:molybdopterin molybdotransferase